MKSYLKSIVLIGLLLLVLFATVSCKDVLRNLLVFGEDDSATTPHTHTFGNWSTVKSATCTEKGQQERTCSCGKKETQEINALGHTQVIDAAVSPTCTTDGLSAGMHCSVCGEILLAQEVTPAAHIWAQTELVRAATCFIPGEEQRVCRTCGAEETAQIEVLVHNFVQNEETKLYSCTICDARVFAGHLYAAFDGDYHWFDAYQSCEDMGGHLATVTSKYEQAVIDNLMSSDMRTTESYWIGGIRLTDGFHWVTGEAFEYTNWKSGQPNFNRENQYFIRVETSLLAAVEQSGLWNDDDYQYKYGFVCEFNLDVTECEHSFTEWETTTEASCWNNGEQWRVCTYCGLEETKVLPQLEHNFTFAEETGMTTCEHCNGAKYNGHIYVIFNDETSWFEAYSRCEALGGHLATITSEKEQMFVISYFHSINCDSYTWLGGYSDGKQWHWVTDELFEYTYWGKGEPTNTYGQEWVIHLNHYEDLLWNDIPPLKQYAYLCEFECEE